jgi:hypothetical protein
MRSKPLVASVGGQNNGVKANLATGQEALEVLEQCSGHGAKSLKPSKPLKR